MKRTWIIIQLLLVIQLSVGYSQGIIFSEGFESGEIPLNWKQEFVSGSVNWRFEDGGYTTTPLIPNSRKPVSAHGGDYNALFQFQNLNNEATKLITCQISALEFAIKPELHFWNAQYEWKHGTQFYNDELRIYYKTGLTSPWHLLQEYTQKTEGWVERIILLPENDLSATYYLGFEGKTKWGWGACVDDIQIIETGVLQKYLSDIQVTQASTIPVSTGSENNPVLRLDLKIMGNSGSCPLDSLIVTSLNTSDADLKTNGVKLFITESPEFNALNQIGAGVNFIGGKAKFKDLNYDLPPGYSYLWLAYDIESLAEHQHIIDAKFTANSIAINNTLYFTGEESPEGKRSILRSLYFDDFETNRGWILSGEFEYGTPLGLGGFQGNSDPSGSYSGTKCIGTDFSGLGEFPGDYEVNLADKAYVAISDTFDFTYYNDLSIRYMRWLNIGNDDYASIDVSSDGGLTWHEVWSNSGLILDGNWTLHEVNISEFAARKNNVLIRFSLGPTNDYWQFSGWNIDDFGITGKFVSKDVGVASLISPSEGCGHTNSDSVTVVVKNFGADDSGGVIPLQYSFHGHVSMNYDTLYQVIPFGDSVQFTFKKKADLTIPDIYSFSATSDMQDDEDLINDEIAKSFYVQPTIDIDHTETFESKGGLWMAKPYNASSWECGFPGFGIDPPSGSKLWMTKLLYFYPNNDSSFVEGICYRNQPDNNRKILQLDYWVDSESNIDGASVQYSQDNGINWQLVDTTIAGWNWYNDTLSALNSPGWSGNSEGWISTRLILPKAITDAPTTKFRLAFASDEFNNGIGFAFDNFSVKDAPPDIAVSQIDSFATRCQNLNPDQVTVTIMNMGLNPLKQNDTIIAGFDFKSEQMAIDTFKLASDLLPGQTVKHTFNEAIDIKEPGNYNLTAYTLLEDDPYFYLGNNDTVSVDFEVLANPITSLFDTIPTRQPDTVVIRPFYNPDYDYLWHDLTSDSIYRVHDDGWHIVTVTATRGNGCFVKDSTYVQLLFNDAGADSLIYPVDHCGLTKQEYLTVRIRNYGTDSITSGQKIAVVYTLNAGSPVADTLVLTNALYSERTVDFTFTKGPVDLSVKGIYSFKVYTAYAGDTIPVNDTIISDVEILGRPEVNIGPDVTVEALSYTLDAGYDYVSYFWDNEITTQTREITETGTYWVQVFDENGCDNYDTATIRLRIRDISPGGFVSPVSDCRFDPAEPVTLRILNSGTDTVPTGTSVSVSYRFQKGTRISESLNLTEDLFPGGFVVHTFPETLDLNNPADYSLEATVVINGDLRTANDTSISTIYRYAKPVVDFGLENTEYVEDISLQIEAGYSAYYTYQWQDGFTDHMYTATTSGLYHVVATDLRTACFDRDSVTVFLIYSDVGITWSDMPVNGCTGDFGNVRVRVQNLGPSVIGSSAPIYVACDVNGTRVTVDTLLRSANFNSGASLDLTLSGTIAVNEEGITGIAFYTLYDADKKPENDTLVVEFDALPAPVIDFGDVNGYLNTDLPHQLDAGAGHKSYLWQDNSTGQTYTVTMNGVYTVTVTGQNDCRTTKTVSINMSDGVDGITGGAGDVIIYPNPNQGLFNVLPEADDSDAMTVILINSQGQTVYINKFSATELAHEQIDVQHLSTGIYQMLIQTEKHVYRGKMIIQ